MKQPTPVTASERVGAEPHSTTPVIAGSQTKKYIAAGLAVVIISIGLLFVLERQGRISTGLFSGVDTSPVALVNGTEIKRADYTSSVAQLKEMATAQGASTSDATLIAQLETQALDTLVNGELLRQEAIASGKVASPEEIDARLAEIEAGVGGAELLEERMSEFNITMETLRRDIENEILIQALFNDVIGTEMPEVADADIESYYEAAGGVDADLPPLADVRGQIIEEIQRERQQAEVAEYLETLRAKSEIEVLL